MNLINILQWNCNGLNNKNPYIDDLNKIYKPLVMGLQETKLVNNKPIKVNDYLLYNSDDSINQNAGAAILVKNTSTEFTFQLIDSPEYTESNIQSSAVLVSSTSTPSFDFFICSVYCQPIGSMPTKSLKLLLESFIDKSTGKTPPFIIFGDFNARHISWDPNIRNTGAHLQSNTSRGIAMRDFIDENNLIILNNNEDSTRVLKHANNQDSSPDISLCSIVS